MVDGTSVKQKKNDKEANIKSPSELWERTSSNQKLTFKHYLPISVSKL